MALLSIIVSRSQGIYNFYLEQIENSKHKAVHQIQGVSVSYVQYPYSAQSRESELQIWERIKRAAVKDLVNQCDTDYDTLIVDVKNFLRFYQLVKDPITPVSCYLDDQAIIFCDLLNEVKKNVPQSTRSSEWENILTQLALESSFLSLPKAKEIKYIVNKGHQQLPVTNVGIKELKITERPDPQRTAQIAIEMISDYRKNGAWKTTPIMITYVMDRFSQATLIPIDGNNRLTAILLLSYFSENLSLIGNKSYSLQENINAFINKNGIDKKFLLTLAPCAEYFIHKADYISIIAQNSENLFRFDQCLIPAILTQEANFFVQDVSRSTADDIVVIQPMVQSLFASTDEFIDSKRQSHGRSMLSEKFVFV